MAETVRNYARYVQSEHAWMLGRVVIPSARLAEFGDAVRSLGDPSGEPWRVSALAASPTDADALQAFGREFAAEAKVDAIETRAATASEVRDVVTRFAGDGVTVYVETASDAALSDHLDAITLAGARAKLRTGGVKPEMFVPPAAAARFLVDCAERRLAFKATAGLHHMRPGERALTYAADAPCGRMHGFLNMFGAAALLWSGVIKREQEVAEMLEAGEVALRADALEWRGHSISARQIADARENFAIAFGSCSFAEPLEELQQEGLV